ncbi:MAG: MerR family transcriptional regulator [Gammaproteobacteria bacterium]
MRLPPKSQRDFLKIGELAELLGTTPRTIRLYEELGLIVPGRTEGKTRLYAHKDLKRLTVVLKMGKIGIELETMQRLAQTREQCSTGKEASIAVLALLEDLRGRIRSLMNSLEELDRDLDRASTLIHQCADCPNRPNRADCPLCPVDKNIDSTDIARLVWDPDCP